MNIYEIFVTVVENKDPRGGGVRKRLTMPVLVAAINATQAKLKIRRAYSPLYKGKHKIKVTYSKADCIISNR